MPRSSAAGDACLDGPRTANGEDEMLTICEVEADGTILDKGGGAKDDTAGAAEVCPDDSRTMGAGGFDAACGT